MSSLFPILIALLIFVAALGGTYWVLRDMTEKGISIAAPGSCRSKACGDRCAPATSAARDESAVPELVTAVADEEIPRREAS